MACYLMLQLSLLRRFPPSCLSPVSRLASQDKATAMVHERQFFATSSQLSTTTTNTRLAIGISGFTFAPQVNLRGEIEVRWSIHLVHSVERTRYTVYSLAIELLAPPPE